MEMNKEKILKAGKIASELKEYAKTIIKPGIPLLEIAEKIETKMNKLGGKPAFPTNLSINEIAAHYTPGYNDETLAHGLLKVDLGVHIDGWISDTAFSIDLENSDDNKKLIEASKAGLEKAQEIIKKGKTTSEIGEAIDLEIQKKGFIPIINLSGHQIEKYDLHAGLTIPNIDDKKNIPIESGLYAIEPFATLSSGSGKIYDGRPSGIYILQEEKNIRNPRARQILKHIIEKYKTLPFCSRWIVKKFGTSSLIYLKQLETNGNIYQFNQLIETTGKKISQTENTIFLTKEGEKIITTK